jgi:8-oxo-dGTP diphosphatase
LLNTTHAGVKGNPDETGSSRSGILLITETMLGKKLNASNFLNKLISLALLEKLDEKKSIGTHRSPTFYKFNSKVYSRALKEGLVSA